MAYTGDSIVDYLKSVGQASDFASRSSLAKQKGIQNYTGTGEQNIQLLNVLRTPQTVVQPTQPTPQVTPEPIQQPVVQQIPQPAPQVQQPTQQTTQPIGQSIGQYKGVNIYSGSDQDIQAQMARIDSGQQTQIPQQIQQSTQQQTPQAQKTNLGQYKGIDIVADPNDTADIQRQFAEIDARQQKQNQEQQQLEQQQSGTQTTSGFDDLFSQFGLSTKASLDDIVKTLSKTYGMESINKEITELDDQYADDVQSVNSNPWLSEGLRSKKIALLQDKYETKKNAYIDRLKTQGDIIGQAINLYQNEKNLQKELLFKSIEQRQQEIKNKIDAAKIAADATKGFELSQGQSRYEYNPTTGQYEVVASVAPKAVAGTKTKPATATQQLLSGYTIRIEQALPILKQLENEITGMNYLSFKAQEALPSTFQSSEFQQYDQAARNFINAVLRRESGAAIAPSEFENARKQYLPMPGDSNEVLKQKEVNRNLVFQNYKSGSGSAYQSVEDALKGVQPQMSEEDVWVTEDGTEYVKGEDGNYYPR